MSAKRKTINLAMHRDTDATVLESDQMPSAIILRVKMTKGEILATASLLQKVADAIEDEEGELS